jgi:hypothetical protein
LLRSERPMVAKLSNLVIRPCGDDHRFLAV